MNSATMATNLLGRPVQLLERRVGVEKDTGQISMIYIDTRGLHFVLLMGGQLIEVDRPEDFRVLEDLQAV